MPADLHHFLLRRFRSDELRRLIRSLPAGQDLDDALPGDLASHALLVDAVIRTMEQNGALDTTFYDALRQARPRLVAEIDAMAGLAAPSGGRLDPHTVRAIAAAATGLYVAGKRDFLLLGLPRAYAASLPLRDAPRDQALSDIMRLNSDATLAAGEVPLAVWLGNAAEETKLLPVAADFRRWRDSFSP